MRIRQAAAEDARAVTEIHIKSRQTAWRRLLDGAYLSGLDVTEEERAFSTSLAAPDQGWRVLVADDGGAVLGFVSLRIEPEDNAVGHLGALFVAPDRFKTGVGTALLQAASDELSAEGARKAFLWVLEEDRRVVEFYEMRGWKRDGRRMMIELDRPRTVVRCTKRLP